MQDRLKAALSQELEVQGAQVTQTASKPTQAYYHL